MVILVSIIYEEKRLFLRFSIYNKILWMNEKIESLKILLCLKIEKFNILHEST